MRAPDPRTLAAFTSVQHGLVSRAQLTELGYTRQHLRALVSRGHLEPLSTRVFALVGAPVSVERQLMFGLLTLGPAAVVSHEAAARLHGFDRCLPDAVEFTVPRARRSAGGSLRVHSSGRLAGIDRVRVAGFPCTSATRTIIDLAASGISERRLEAAIDSAVHSGATAHIVLRRRLEALRGSGRRGVSLLERVLPDSGGHTRLERRFLALMRGAGLPRPRTQVVFRKGSRTVARVDFLFQPDVVVEVSGRKGHASDAERAKDAQRRNELQDAGQRVYEYTAREVFEDGDSVVRSMSARLSVMEVVGRVTTSVT